MECARSVADTSGTRRRGFAPESNRRLLMCCSQQAFAHNIKAALAKYPEDGRKDVVVLFSAHSLPLEIVKYAFPSVFCKPR